MPADHVVSKCKTWYRDEVLTRLYPISCQYKSLRGKYGTQYLTLRKGHTATTCLWSNESGIQDSIVDSAAGDLVVRSCPATASAYDVRNTKGNSDMPCVHIDPYAALHMQSR
ncbi:hypothetical protein M8818_003599 [Zalaria obscura]|uniref:Uncharacterized protein n=1 Tax=Zalaria obscura TaxID=2024903 RepID=A0ACC3SGV0_9PEZI